MFIEQRLEKLDGFMESVKRDLEILAAGAARIEQRQSEIEEAVQSVSRSSGVDAERIAMLLAEVAQNIYPGPYYSSAPKGTTQVDGVPTDKPAIGLAQKAEEVSPTPSSSEEDPWSSEGGETRSPEVVASDGEAEASPPADEPTVAFTIEGRAIHGPRASIFVQPQQAKILQRLLTGPATVYDLCAATGDPIDAKGQTACRMRMANMRSILADAGIEIHTTRMKNGQAIFGIREKAR